MAKDEELEGLIESFESLICGECEKRFFCKKYDAQVCEALSLLRTLVNQGEVSLEHLKKLTWSSEVFAGKLRENLRLSVVLE